MPATLMLEIVSKDLWKLKLPFIKYIPKTREINDVAVTPYTSPGAIAKELIEEHEIFGPGPYQQGKGPLIEVYVKMFEQIYPKILSGEVKYVNNLTSLGGREKRISEGDKPNENKVKSRVVFCDDFLNTLICGILSQTVSDAFKNKANKSDIKIGYSFHNMG